MKLGSLRVYIDTHSDDKAVNETVHSEISKLRDLMSTPQNLRNVQASIRAAHRKRQKSSRTQ